LEWRKKKVKFHLTLILGMLLLPVSCSLQHFAEQTAPPLKSEAKCGENGGAEFWVVNLGWHAGIIIRTGDLSDRTKMSLAPASRHPYIEFGWGDRDFYMSPEYSWAKALDAAFFSNSAAVHIAGFSEIAFQNYISDKEVVHVTTESGGLDSMLDFILSYLSHDANGEALRIGSSLYGEGFFAQSTGKFSLSYTCNTWVAHAIATAGCRIDPDLVRVSTLMKRLSEAQDG